MRREARGAIHEASREELVDDACAFSWERAGRRASQQESLNVLSPVQLGNALSELSHAARVKNFDGRLERFTQRTRRERFARACG